MPWRCFRRRLCRDCCCHAVQSTTTNFYSACTLWNWWKLLLYKIPLGFWVSLSSFLCWMYTCTIEFVQSEKRERKVAPHKLWNKLIVIQWFAAVFVVAAKNFTTKNSFHTFSHHFFFWLSLYGLCVCMIWICGINLCNCVHVHRRTYSRIRWMCQIELI